MRVLVLGVKEFPLGTSTDPIPSGGIETYWQRHAPILAKTHYLIILTRRFPNLPRGEALPEGRVVRVPWLPGMLLRTPSFILFSALWLLFHTKEYDVIIANGPWAGFFASLTKILHRRRVLFIPHGIAHTQPTYPRWTRFLHRIIEKGAYLFSDGVLFFTPGEAEKYITVLSVPRKKHTFIVLPVVSVPRVTAEEKKAMRASLGVNGKPVIMFVGRLVKVKGVDILIRAFKLVAHQTDAVLVIVGDGPELENLRHLAADLGIADRVIFTGWRKDASRLVSIADLFVLPSISEGLPQALLEALAHGVRCVVSDIPQLRGLPVTYFTPGDYTCLARILVEILHTNKKTAK